MELSDFFQICIYIIIGLVIFTLFFNFLVGYEIFGSAEAIGLGTECMEEPNNIFSKISGFTGGMENVWLAVTTVGFVGAITLAVFMRSSVPIAAYLFGSIFFTSYFRCINVININEYIPGGILLIITVGVLFLFTASYIGMFGGK